MSELSIRPSGGGVGAFVEGIDLAGGLDQGEVGALRQGLGDHGVLFFRDQRLDPEAHQAFAENFGEINVNRFFTPVDGHPGIAQVLTDTHHAKNIGGGWHTDHSYDLEPAMGSVLLAHEVPETGGDTIFANMYRAYDSLSEGLKATLGTLRAEHSSRHVFGSGRKAVEPDPRFHNAEEATQDAVHPVVIRHPISGRKSLYVNPGFTLRFEGWTDAESKPLLDFLYAHAQRPEHTYRYSWAEGSIAFWDNRATWHYALNDYPGQRRLMHRVTIEGVLLDR